MTDLGPGPVRGLIPYDLVVPKKSFWHLFSRRSSETVIEIGSDVGDGAKLRKKAWSACADGCCEASAGYQIVLPCPELPHCGHCECPDAHYITLSDQDIEKIKGLLP